MGVEVEGLRETVRSLEKAGVEVADLKEVFAPIAAEAADVTRGFLPRRSGKLMSSARGNKAKNKAVVTIGRASVPYAGPIIYGWPKRGIKAARTNVKVDQVMETRAPQMLEDGIYRIFEKYGITD